MTTIAARSGKPPEVSLGLLVYNGERHLPAALDAILAQTFGDFELIIGDNASSDATPDIVREYARKDSRIRLFRHQRNIGLARNFNFTVDVARGGYFKYLSANDEYAASLVEDCVEALRRRPAAVLSFGKAQFIDQHGARLETYPERLSADMEDPLGRFDAVRSQLGLATPLQCGLIRVGPLRACGPLGSFRGADLPLIAGLALYGPFILLDKILLFRRLGREVASNARTELENAKLFEPDVTRPDAFPGWRAQYAYLRAMIRAPLPATKRLRGIVRVVRHATWNRRELAAEIGAAIRRRPPA